MVRCQVLVFLMNFVSFQDILFLVFERTLLSSGTFYPSVSSLVRNKDGMISLQVLIFSMPV